MSRGGHGLILAAEWGHADGPRPRCYLGRWGMADQVISSGQIMLIDHAPTDSRYAAPAFGTPCQSLLGVPLRRGDRVIGALNVTSHSTAFAFHQTHIDLLATIASYAAMGIEVAGLLEERKEQIRQLRYLHQQAPTLIRAPVLPALFQDAARMAADLLGTGQAAIYVPGGRTTASPSSPARAWTLAPRPPCATCPAPSMTTGKAAPPPPTG